MNVSTRICNVCSSASLEFMSRALALSLCLCSCSSSSGCRFQSRRRRESRRRSPPPPGPSAERKGRERVRTFLLKYKTLRVMSAKLPVFPAGSPLPYTGCSFSPAGCPPSAGPPGLWPLLGQHRVLEPAPLLRRRRWQPGGKKQRNEGFHI